MARVMLRHGIFVAPQSSVRPQAYCRPPYHAIVLHSGCLMNGERGTGGLRPDTVDLWRVSLSPSPETLPALESYLQPPELDRSRQFRFSRDRLRYLISRGALREILSRYLGGHPSRLTFGYGPSGKPFLASPPGGCEIRFNLAHCEDLALVAVAAGRRVGVDVERIREIAELDDIMERHFTGSERSFVRAARGEDRTRSFLAVWTRREAIAKALGLDLQTALGPLSIPLYTPGQRVRLDSALRSAPDTGHSGPGWSLEDIPLDSRHIGALCVEGETFTTVLREYSPS
jgi:4'-phosphopantetheinyl transferase